MVERILPKKGIERPTTRVEKTNAVLMAMAYQCDLLCLDGINSSRLSATGDMVKAYVLSFIKGTHNAKMIHFRQLYGKLTV